jgi:hypothetical protein
MASVRSPFNRRKKDRSTTSNKKGTKRFFSKRKGLSAKRKEGAEPPIRRSRVKGRFKKFTGSLKHWFVSAWSVSEGEMTLENKDRRIFLMDMET